ncbi:MAG: hypothetical protein QGI93_13920 [Planctomycetota bacterium]|nr:hypothetical protein [Planctomycetota bacterium]
MAKRRDNMLEAFQASSATDNQGDGDSSVGGGGPTPGRAPGGGSAGLVLPMGSGTFLLLQGVLLVLAFLAGQASGDLGVVQAQGLDEGPSTVMLEGPGFAAEPSGGATAGRDAAQAQAPLQTTTAQDGEVLSTRPDRGSRRPAAGPGGASGQQLGGASATKAGSPADAAFADPANRFTLLVFTADGTDFGWEMAKVNHANLSAQGFAVIEPRERGGKVLLHVGAFGSFAAAEQVRTKVADAPGPDGKQTPYAGAYVVNITR